jgi:ASTRA-associated protein 1
VRHPLVVRNAASGAASPKPLKTIQTKHSGQQSLVIRSDSKIFTTAGWDNKVRVYSLSTLKELAVLKWHKEGIYSVAFAEILRDETELDADVADEGDSTLATVGTVSGSGSEVVVVREVERKRNEKARMTHWLAAGSKDGKVSLWEIY